MQVFPQYFILVKIENEIKSEPLIFVFSLIIISIAGGYVKFVMLKRLCSVKCGKCNWIGFSFRGTAVIA